MEFDIEELKKAGADGIVLGVLLPNGDIDWTNLKRLLPLANPYVTFCAVISVSLIILCS